MNFEDSRNALYHDPNAYIQKTQKKPDNSVIKKVVFQEPYECLPNFHLNNDFKKNYYDCVHNPKQKNDCDCKQEKCNTKNNNSFPFDIKNFLPFLTAFGGSNTGGLSNIISMLSNSNNDKSKGGFDFSNLVSTLMQNKGGLGGLLNLFGDKSKQSKKEIKSTDFQIKDYTKVE
ncbi:MAG: hypothetical protein IKM43_03585 [Clostridia bacterium]|nr:hypothetical protein [Clostridia bacterium]